MTFPLEGFNAIAQKHIARGIATTFYAKDPFLYVMAAKTAATTNEPLRIGRPGAGEILAGVPVSKAAKMALQGVNSYNPRIQAFKTSNTKMEGARDTMPGVGSASGYSTTASHGQAVQATAEFHWAKAVTPVHIWNSDIDRCVNGSGSDEGKGIAMGQLIEEATQVAMEEHNDQISARLLYGSPSNQSLDPCDDLQGVILALTNLNTYGKVDRNTLSTGSAWLTNTVTAATSMDIVNLINTANITYKCNVVGSGIDLVLLGGPNYIKAKAQILAKGGVVVQNGGLPEMAKMGVKREVLQYDNTYICHHPGLDTCYANAAYTTTALYTAQPNYALCLNMASWRLMFHPKYNFTVSPFVNLKDKAVGAPNLSQAFIESQLILACDKPAVNCLFTNVT